MSHKNYGRAARMSDAELSKALGHYQKTARLGTIIGLVGVLAGVISFFAVQDLALKSILVAVLFFGGVCCALFIGGGAQKKIKALMQEQMGDFFNSELENAFGPAMHTDKMRIDEPLIKSLRLLENQWEENEVENFREGEHCGVHFSAANVRLNHVYERGAPQDGLETCRDMVFKGIIIRLEMNASTQAPIIVSARTEDSPSGVKTGDAEFDRCFCTVSDRADEAVAFLTPQLTAQILDFCRNMEGQLLGFSLDGDTISLAIESDYAFARVASSVDLRNLSAVRSSYANSLKEMGDTIDLLTRDSDLFTAKN